MVMCRLISVVHLVAHFHVVGVVHDVLDHVLEHRVPWDDRVEFRVAVLRLRTNEPMIVICRSLVKSILRLYIPSVLV